MANKSSSSRFDPWIVRTCLLLPAATGAIGANRAAIGYEYQYVQGGVYGGLAIAAILAVIALGAFSLTEGTEKSRKGHNWAVMVPLISAAMTVLAIGGFGAGNYLANEAGHAAARLFSYEIN